MLTRMRTADFEYELPEELISQFPTADREASRLLVLQRESESLEHRSFKDILSYFRPGDLLVLNNSKVFPARLRGMNARSRGRFEVLLLEETNRNTWWAMVRPGKRARIGTTIEVQNPDGTASGVSATVLGINAEGHRHLSFRGTGNILESVWQLGDVPLPPYIQRAAEEADLTRYQTVYAAEPGSVAAPTAGLHFTEGILRRAREAGAEIAFVTLHVGLGTFAPVKAESVADHPMHEERFELPAETVRLIDHTREHKGRVFAVGTTTTRVLESAAAKTSGRLGPMTDKTRLFIYPPYKFHVVDALLTNFHLPRSTLLMLVSAFADPGGTRGIGRVKQAYASAVEQRYRFFSYGDAMLLV